MTSSLDLINQLPVLDPRSILRALAEYAQQFSLWSEDRFEVTLLLQSGQVLSGKAARLGRDLDNECVLLYQGSEKDPSIVFLRLADVVGIRLNDPATAQRVFDAQRERASMGPGVTAFEAKRSLENLNVQLLTAKLPKVECDWDSIGSKEESLSRINRIFTILPAVLTKINADRLGQEALKQITTLFFRNSESLTLTATRKGERVELSYDFRRALPNLLESVLQETIEKIF